MDLAWYFSFFALAVLLRTPSSGGAKDEGPGAGVPPADRADLALRATRRVVILAAGRSKESSGPTEEHGTDNGEMAEMSLSGSMSSAVNVSSCTSPRGAGTLKDKARLLLVRNGVLVAILLDLTGAGDSEKTIVLGLGGGVLSLAGVGVHLGMVLNSILSLIVPEDSDPLSSA